jgi:hypothetical protein
METKKGMRTIWFFVGWILLLIGLVESIAGIYDLIVPSKNDIRLADLHANLWWGILISLLGIVYLLKNKDKYIGM